MASIGTDSKCADPTGATCAADADLSGLKLGALSKLARDVGVDTPSLELALDADDPKAAVIELLHAMPAADGPTGGVAAQASEADEARLNKMKTKELKEMLTALGLETKGKKSTLVGRLLEAGAGALPAVGGDLSLDFQADQYDELDGTDPRKIPHASGR